MKVVTGGVFVLVLLLATSALSQVPDDKLIVPGQRIGKWTLDMTIDELLRMNGPRNAVGPPPLSQLRGPDVADDLWVHRWFNVGIFAFTIGRESREVIALVTASEGYKTDKGVGIGSSREAVLNAYGTPAAATEPQPGWWSGIYDAIGVAFQVDPNNVALIAFVFRSGSAKRVFRY